MAHLNPLISDLALILGVAGITTLLFKKLKQPVVLGYIVAGFLCSGNFLLEGVSNVDNVNIWAEIGIIFLLFSLGLEFSFNKLLEVGGSALMTALVIILGMMCTGFMAGRLLGWTTTDSVFLGGMLSMSSTTIIIKAFDDLGLRNRKFTGQVFGVLIVEDLFAVVLLVLFSTIYMQKATDDIQIFGRLFKLLFFLVAWFVVAIYLIPTLLTRIRRFLNDETLLVISLGLCLGMVVLATSVGFSSALGAFVMGSVLAGTTEAKRIEKVMAPVKDLFGAIFFVSVGMLVEPALLWQYIGPIILLTLVVIVGQIVYGTIGFMVSGQDLRLSLQSSFSLAQIGEFAFIIAALGLTLGVTSSFLYPVAVAVSVITTFTTPFIIKQSEPAYHWLDKHMPRKIKVFLSQYSSASQSSENQSAWKQLLKRSLFNIAFHCIILGGMVWVSVTYYMPWVEKWMPGFWGNVLSTGTTILFMAPFLWTLAIRHLNRKLLAALWNDPRFNHGLLVGLVLLRIFMALAFVMVVLVHLYSYRWGTIIGFLMIVLSVLIFWKRIKNNFLHLEKRFFANLNGSSSEKITVLDTKTRFLHLAHLTVSSDCRFIGRSLRMLDLRTRRGITVVSIQRGSRSINIPQADEVLLPADRIAVVGTDTELKRFAAEVEASSEPTTNGADDVVMRQFSIDPSSMLVDMTVAQFVVMCRNEAAVIGIERKDGSFVEPLSLVRFRPYDLVWVAGTRDCLRLMLGNDSQRRKLTTSQKIVALIKYLLKYHVFHRGSNRNGKMNKNGRAKRDTKTVA